MVDPASGSAILTAIAIVTYGHAYSTRGCIVTRQGKHIRPYLPIGTYRYGILTSHVNLKLNERVDSRHTGQSSFRLITRDSRLRYKL
jgi:hypothetical protein